MNKLKSILLASVLICTMSSNVKTKTLLESLQTYCVPKSGSDCSADVRGVYNEAGNFCACSTVLKYYKATERVCKDCITGSFAKTDYTDCNPINCPPGYHAELITDGKCPSGYALKQVTSGKCPTGNALKTWTYSTKTWK